MKYDFKKLKKAREDRLMTKSELAKAAGISHTAVAQVESGKGWTKAVRAMSAVLGIDNLVLRSRKSA